MPSSKSPLRYPGGKAKLYNFVKRVLEVNGLLGETYAEPFAGGAGLALKLLLNGDVKRVIINDLDPAVYYFWLTIINETNRFCNKIDSVDLTINEWKKQREIYNKANLNNIFEYAFSFFYLNRTNVSGVVKGGVIGGLDQAGPYKIDARFNREGLKKRIYEIASHKNQIVITNYDANEFITGDFLKHYYKVFINFDPPYVKNGYKLYQNSFKEEDHRKLCDNIKKCNRKWMVTYDVCNLIYDLYSKYPMGKTEINYSVKTVRKEQEYVFFNNNVIIPEEFLEGDKMKCTNECRFCSIMKGEYKLGNVDRPIFQNDKFMAISTVGALINGWVLIIPKNHCYSMREYYSNPCFIDFVNNVIKILSKKYNKEILAFEHGANKFGSLTACGTNHAHLHLVPFYKSILAESNEELSFRNVNFDKIKDHVDNNEYLLYSDIYNNDITQSEFYIHDLKTPMSQFFRKVIANQLCIPEKFNYKENLNLNIAEQTYNELFEEVF